ncbi:hypothetical protein F4859DRAFT_523005 [Xylaria cf. heliscus]|nr:hypothetical protein F4859DRAFT_523005 [Xylaria cf. heliscus]
MSSQYPPDPRVNPTDHGNASSASTATPSNGAALHHAHPEQHTKFMKFTSCNITCDSCQQRRTTSIQMCSICGHKTCFQCHMNRQYDSQHILAGLGLDWGFANEHTQRQNDPKISNDTQPSAGNFQLQRVAPRPTAGNYYAATYHGQAGGHEGARQYTRMVQSINRNDGGQHLQNTGVTSAVVDQNGEPQLRCREQNPQGQVIPYQSSAQSQSVPSNVQQGSLMLRGQAYGIPNGNSRVPIHIANQPRVHSGGVAIINGASSGTREVNGHAQSSTNTATGGVRWNHEMFPCANEYLFIKVLLEGGQNTIRLSRIGDGFVGSALALYDATTAMTFLKQSQWAVNNPGKFRVQSVCVNNLITVWLEHPQILHYRRRNGDIQAIAMLECTFALHAMSHGVPTASFWVVWLTGMRQALQGPILK